MVMHAPGPAREIGRAAVAVAALLLASGQGGSAQAGLGITRDELIALSYGNNLPGFTAFDPVFAIDRALPGNGLTSMIGRTWHPVSQRTCLIVEVRFFERRSNLEAHVAEFHRISQARIPKDPPEATIGDASWRSAHGSLVITRFSVGRVLVDIRLEPLNRHPDPGRGIADPDPFDEQGPAFAANLAKGLEFALRQSPGLVGASDASTASASNKPAPIVTLGGRKWVALAALKTSGLRVRWDDRTAAGSVASATSSLAIRLWQQKARVGERETDLGAPVLLCPSAPIVAVDGLQRALGIAIGSRAGRVTVR